MTNWDTFTYFGSASVALWAAGAWAAWRQKPARTIFQFYGLGILVYLTFIFLLWNDLHRPPMRTIGETRMWYSFFLSVTGLLIYARWRYRWILWLSTIMASVFIGIDIIMPENHDRTLMPALQSPWFVPHVAVYMFAYALTGTASLIALRLLLRYRGPKVSKEIETTDNLMNAGLALLTFGMLFGALWAKEAWGHYWTWDPKETWAAVTWLSCLVYIHFRQAKPQAYHTALWMLIFTFALMQMCWWGVNYLPATSIHTYGVN